MINAAIGAAVSTFFYWVGILLFAWLVIGFLSGVAITLWHYSRNKDKEALRNRVVMCFFFSVFGIFNTFAVWEVYQDEKDNKK